MPATIRSELRETIHTLRAQGVPVRQISRLLKLSRNTVRRIVRTCPATPDDEPAGPRAPCPPETLALIERVFTRCRGNVVRVHEVLAQEHQLHLAYSSLTRWVREAELRTPPRRAGSYTFDPGAEMHHDTSPHRLVIAAHTVTAQCASLVLAYSRRLFMRYYPRFTRFEAKAFLADAFAFMDGACARCVVDNTSVLVASGAGPDATFAPEMAAFARAYGVTFWAHRINDPDRKPRVERPFAYIESNFLAGRVFDDWDDLNAQALAWCITTTNAKPTRALGMSPEAAYVLEKPHLIALPEHQSCSPAELLYRLLLEEDRCRRERSLENRLDQAKLPWPWTLASFPFDRQPGLDRAQVQSLASLDFVRRADNLVLVGPPGVGKSGIAIALLREACLNGYRARFYNAQDLLDELYASLADRSSAKLLNRLARYDVLLIDEIGYLTLKPEQSNAFFKLMDQRYQRVSTVITTNLLFDDWYELFGKKTLVDAMLDRLQHRCITIKIDGPSLRVPEPHPEPNSDPSSPVKKRRMSKKTRQQKPARQR